MPKFGTPEEVKAKKEATRKEINDFLLQERSEKARYLRRVPQSMQPIFYRVLTCISGRPERVKAKCLDCSNFQREEVKNCPINTCPLWDIRPYRD